MTDFTHHVRHDLATVRDMLERLRLRVAEQHELLEILMSLNDDLTTDLDTLSTAVTGVVNAYVASNKVIADLQAQIAAGPPGLTADQATAIQARFTAVNAQIAAALAPAGVTVTPTTPAQPA